MLNHKETTRRKSRLIKIGVVPVGGCTPVVVQSMTNTDTRDHASTLKQVRRLARHGSELVRVAVPDADAAEALSKITAKSPVPIIADIQFSHKLALASIEAGVQGLRINPGNLGQRWQVEEVVRAATEKGVPIRIGVNSGSVQKSVLKKNKGDIAAALVESAMEQVKMIEDLGFNAIKLSLKASDVNTTVRAYEMIADMVDYPLHLGITEAGTRFTGTVRSAVGLGILLHKGIGDTIRVSLASDPVEEVRVAYSILKALGLRKRGADVIACPTCARSEFDVIKVAEQVEKKLEGLERPLVVAVMGCIVNGPGEAAIADIGAVGTKKGVQIYRAGKRDKIVPKNKVTETIMELVKRG